VKDGAGAAIVVEETVWIAMSDGRKLAGRLFRPADGQPVPCVLEYLPYRRRDGTRLRDDANHGWFAAHGYAGLRVDIAGTGDSDGLIGDEYVAREQDDACEIIAWAAAQAWCAGPVAIYGISWGGVNGLQIGARRPPALKAIVTACTPDDRFATDCHYMGGCLLNDNFGWAGSFFGYAARPPDPAAVGERWRDLWAARIGDVKLFAAEWLRHARRDDYWKQGSVSQDYSQITAPTLIVGGWLDGYTPVVFSLLENLTAPRKALLGPWGHKFPHQGVPGPAIDFLAEVKRWLDHWLKGQDTGVADDPDLRVYLMEGAEPLPHIAYRRGEWLGVPVWPAPQVAATSYRADGMALAPGAATGAPDLRLLSSPQTTGMRGQEWCPYGQGRIAAEGAVDQREDDALSLCFDTAPLTDALSILGRAHLQVRLASDQPQAMIAARLCDVAPDGTSSLIAFGLLNLSHRGGSDAPVPMTPGQPETVTLAFKQAGQVVPPGHRLRLALSSALWPMVWPSPQPVVLTVDAGTLALDLPLLASRDGLTTPVFALPQEAKVGASTVLRQGTETRRIHLGVEDQSVSYDILSDDGDVRIEDTGTTVFTSRAKTYAIRRNDPGACATSVKSVAHYRRDDWDARLETTFTVTSTATHFRVVGQLRAFDGGQVFAARDWDETIPRDCL
jgi:putative CocE/NonD family hydrolase